ncbi:MAG TPA: hypothetical protein VGB24_07140 [Longimicrobium sp.]|jgi:hypothetical protein|uniref:hypothetical protein n=1 Tax=Longimicrobium sp. TaxID=2029185 RepID=UPI002ED90EE6
MVRPTLLAAACVAALAALGCDGGTAAQTGPPTVRLNFADPGRQVRSMVGFLHAFSPTTPGDSLFAPLRPALWRAGPMGLNRQAVERSRRMGARPVLVLSDLYRGYPLIGWQAPYADWEAWEARVREVARATKGQGLIYDVWNEPDTPVFWTGGDDLFFETFRRAERVLRQELGSEAVVAGPSFATWDEARIARFMEYCRTNGVRVDVLAWHEFHLDKTLPRIADNIKRSRRFMEGRYASVGVRELHVQEVGTEQQHFRPGSALAGLFFIEKGGADAAARACWGEPEGDSCWNETLDGLLTPRQERRAVWWAHWAYARTLDARVPSTSNDEGLVSFATRATASEPARVVVGHFDRFEGRGAVEVRVRMENVASLLAPGQAGKVRVVVQRIPLSGGAALHELPVEQEFVVDASAAVVEVVIPDFGVYEGRVLTLTPAPASP